MSKKKTKRVRFEQRRFDWVSFVIHLAVVFVFTISGFLLLEDTKQALWALGEMNAALLLPFIVGLALMIVPPVLILYHLFETRYFTFVQVIYGELIE